MFLVIFGCYGVLNTQIYYAVIAYCLVAIIQHDMEIVNHL